MKIKLLALCALLVCNAQAQSVLKGTQNSQSTTTSVPLMSIIIPAMQMASQKSEVTEKCFDHFSNQVVKIENNEDILVNYEGKLFENDSLVVTASKFSQYESKLLHLAGRTLLCSISVSTIAVDAMREINKQKPTRDRAIKIASEFFEKRLSSEYNNLISVENPNFNITTAVEQGNGGYSKTTIGPPGGYPPGTQFMVVTNVSKHVQVREVVFNGIYAYSTRPTRVKSTCKNTEGDFPCTSTYTMRYTNGDLNILKNGQPYFNNEFIDGATYTLELSNESSTSTNKKVAK